jgi:hypothetical protein
MSINRRMVYFRFYGIEGKHSVGKDKDVNKLVVIQRIVGSQQTKPLCPNINTRLFWYEFEWEFIAGWLKCIIKSSYNTSHGVKQT